MKLNFAYFLILIVLFHLFLVAGNDSTDIEKKHEDDLLHIPFSDEIGSEKKQLLDITSNNNDEEAIDEEELARLEEILRRKKEQLKKKKKTASSDRTTNNERLSQENKYHYDENPVANIPQDFQESAKKKKAKENVQLIGQFFKNEPIHHTHFFTHRLVNRDFLLISFGIGQYALYSASGTLLKEYDTQIQAEFITFILFSDPESTDILIISLTDENQIFIHSLSISRHGYLFGYRAKIINQDAKFTAIEAFSYKKFPRIITGTDNGKIELYKTNGQFEQSRKSGLPSIDTITRKTRNFIFSSKNEIGFFNLNEKTEMITLFNFTCELPNSKNILQLKFDAERLSDIFFALSSDFLGIFHKNPTNCDFITKVPILETGNSIETVFGYVYLLSDDGNIHFFNNITTEGISFYANFSLFENEKKNEEENKIIKNHKYSLSHKKPFTIISDGYSVKIFRFLLPRPEEWWFETAYKWNPLILSIGFLIGGWRIFKKRWGNENNL